MDEIRLSVKFYENWMIEMPEVISPLVDAIRNGQSTLRALLIGVKNYRYLRSLSCSAADCQGLSETLQKITQVFQHPQIHVHHDHSNRQLTLNAIKESLNELLGDGKVRRTDIVLIYFSGHGVLSKKNNELYLCLPDTEPNNIEETALSIQETLKQLKDSGIIHQVVILDACHSGGAILSSKDAPLSRDIGDFARSIDDDEINNINIEENCADKFETQLSEYQREVNQETQNFYAFLSCSSSQKSWELPKLGYGAFTYSLIQELIDPSVSDDEGFIRLESLAGHVHDKTERLVSQIGERQTPRYLSNSGPGVIIGKVDKLAQLPTQLRPYLLWDENTYKLEYEDAIHKHYPTIPGEEIYRLDALALKCRLSERQKNEIERNAYERCREYVERYRKNLTECIERSKQQGNGIFLSNEETQKIREISHVDGFIDVSVLSQIDEEIRASYVEGYRLQYRRVLYSCGLIARGSKTDLNAPREDRQKLEERREDLNLTPEDAFRIADAQKECFENDLKSFEQQIVQVLYRYGAPISQEQINLCKGELGDRVLEPILNHQISQFYQNLEAFRLRIRMLKHNVQEITQEHIQACQGNIQVQLETNDQSIEEIEFSEDIVALVLEEEENYLKSNIDEFRKRLYDYTRTTIDVLGDKDAQQFQPEPPLGEDIWKPIFQEIREIHQQQVDELLRLSLDDPMDDV